MNNLTGEQQRQLSDFVQTYGIEPEDVFYFNDKPDPFFSYEATGILANKLTDLMDINIEPSPSYFEDSVAVRCTIVDENSRSRAAVGVANVNEKINDQPLSPAQILGLASARAIRNALRVAGIDLVKAHYKAKESGEVSGISPQQESTRSKLLAQVHKLGGEVGLINGKDKSLWRMFLQNRYDSNSSEHFSEALLADLAAVLKTMTPISTDEINRNAADAFNRGFSGRAA